MTAPTTALIQWEEKVEKKLVSVIAMVLVATK